MDDVISRQAAIDEIKQVTIHSEDESLAVEALENLPSVERKGKWIDSSNGWMCSECNRDNTFDTNFCPNCGADMRGGEDEDR